MPKPRLNTGTQTHLPRGSIVLSQKQNKTKTISYLQRRQINLEDVRILLDRRLFEVSEHLPTDRTDRTDKTDKTHTHTQKERQSNPKRKRQNKHNGTTETRRDETTRGRTGGHTKRRNVTLLRRSGRTKYSRCALVRHLSFIAPDFPRVPLTVTLRHNRKSTSI